MDAGPWTLAVLDQTGDLRERRHHHPERTHAGGFDISEVGYGVNIGSVRYGNISPAMNGEIAELVVVHAKIIADATVTSLHDYLKAKYAL